MSFFRIRSRAHATLARTYVTAPFVPPRSLDNIYPASFIEDRPPKPQSPTFYTARADFYDGILQLEDALKACQHALRVVHLFPFPENARENLPPPRLAWKDKEGLSREIGAMLTTSRHRRVQSLLTQLNDMRRIAIAGAEDNIADRIARLLAPFERPDKDQHLARGLRKPARFDEYGRTYALGKRKESAARVWMIPVRPSSSEPSLLPVQKGAEPEHLTPILKPRSSPPLRMTTILVNNFPLATYFPNVGDRQRVVRPFKVCGLFGAFNVFALVRGGGTTGQAGAIAHGIAKNIVAHVPDVELILRRAKLLKRDPRMVERKKTGLAKARKRYAWVKR